MRKKEEPEGKKKRGSVKSASLTTQPIHIPEEPL